MPAEKRLLSVTSSLKCLSSSRKGYQHLAAATRKETLFMERRALKAERQKDEALGKVTAHDRKCCISLFVRIY